jgi:hypothetical protein
MLKGRIMVFLWIMKHNCGTICMVKVVNLIGWRGRGEKCIIAIAFQLSDFLYVYE